MVCSNTVKRMLPYEECLRELREAPGKKALLIRHQPFDPDLPMMCTSSLGIWEVEEEGSGIPANRGYMVSPSSPWATAESGNR